MTEPISGEEDPYYIYKALHPEPFASEQIGRVLFLPSLAIAAGAFVPALVKKKRIYFPIAPTLDYAPSPPPIESGSSEAVLIPQCNSDEQRIVHEIFTTIADSSYWDLLRSAWHLIALGWEIDHIHPFSLFLAMPREKIRSTFQSNDSFKIGKIIGGIDRGMENLIGPPRDLQRETLMARHIDPYLPNLAAEMRKDASQIRRLILAADWQGLVQYLFDIPV